ncbi:hypothetical protein LSH36_155g06003 [Paralvinella palmiformis]|uniref:Uncharacterized protein n=1 Tax=Paralvinella palmiformis TaxID=53620 RepID=A0AAD9N9Q9_9ANNE|nr:hypothetical protein LSH36_155g06003 [Paralvinella palmiformis]
MLWILVNMSTIYFLVTGLICLTITGAEDDDFDRRSDVFNRLREAYFKRGELEKRDCIGLGRPCRSTLAWNSRCCGDTVCYWPNGVSMTKDGYCVKCISNTQKCQLDSQCCELLVCHRESILSPDGRCGPKRGRNEICHENDNCISEKCVKTASSFWTEGRCE